MTRDYLAMAVVEPGDREDHGVKGMKWGIRRDRPTLKAEAAKRASAKPDSNAAVAHPGEHESSQARYSRLHAQAKAGGASSLSDADLKFFNARTEAMAKVEKMNQTNPSWLKTTVKTVAQQAAQKQMQAVTDAIASKYISGPVINALKEQAPKAAEVATGTAPKVTAPSRPSIKARARALRAKSK